MPKVKTSELIGSALDWAVSVAVENSRRFPIWIDGKPDSYANYSTDWGRSGHGVGFWDRDNEGLPKLLGYALTRVCGGFPERNLYIGDDGRVYF